MKTKIKFVPNRLHIKKDDTVQVISGKDKGTVGKVLITFPKKGKIVVEGVNIKTKHIKPSQQNPKGQIIKVPAPIFSCKVMFYSEKHKATSRLGKQILKDGTKVRVLKKFKNEII